MVLIMMACLFVGLFFLFYGIRNPNNASQKSFKLYNLLLFSFILFAIWLPQFSYWKETTGSMLGWTDNQENFFFSQPVLWKGLFSFKKGWFIYTPIMIFAVLGIPLLRKHSQGLLLPVIAFVIINWMIMFSWWCWWYGSSFGQRAMIDSYALMSLPLAASVRYFCNKGKAMQLIGLALSLFFIWLNIFQTFQFENQSLSGTGMTEKIYINQFGKQKKVDDFDKLVQYPDVDAAKNGKR